MNETGTNSGERDQGIDFWVDPDGAGGGGLLLSDRIAFYARRIQLIVPFDEGALRPASYTLHAGKRYILNDKDGDLEKEQEVSVPKNGLIYIQFFEQVNIPYYMIARFNLRVKQVYRGLLLGTGPQVDPGFRGHLFCPIHNFTDTPKRISFREPLATIDFAKTTRFGERTFGGKSPEELGAMPLQEMRYGLQPVEGFEGARCEVFPVQVDRPLREYLPGGETVRSSVYELQEQVRRSDRRMKTLEKRLRRATQISALAALALFVGIGSIFLNAYTNLKTDIVNLSGSVGRISGQLERSRQIEGRATSPRLSGQKSGAVGSADAARSTASTPSVEEVKNAPDEPGVGEKQQR